MTEPTDARPSEPTTAAGRFLWNNYVRHEVIEAGYRPVGDWYSREMVQHYILAIEAEALQPAQPVTDDPLEAVLAAALRTLLVTAVETPVMAQDQYGNEATVMAMTHAAMDAGWAALERATPSGSRLRSAGAERDHTREHEAAVAAAAQSMTVEQWQRLTDAIAALPNAKDMPDGLHQGAAALSASEAG